MMDRRISKAQLVLLAMALTAIPLAAVTSQALRLSTGARVTLPAQIVSAQNDSLVPMAKVQTSLSTLSLDTLSGDNGFNEGDTAYVYLSRSYDYVYPFAIFRRLPAASPEDVDDIVHLRGKVDFVRGDDIGLIFDFNTVSPPQAFLAHISREPSTPVRIDLAVSADGRASVAAFHAGSKIYGQRVMTKSVLDGRSIIMANSAPPT